PGAGAARARTAPPTYWLPSVFVGPLVLAVAAAPFFERERRRLALVLAGIAAAALLLAAAGPPGSWLRAIPPLDRMRYPEKTLAAAVFALAALSGLGLDALRFRAGERALRALFPLIAAAALALALATPGPVGLRSAAAVGLASAAALALAGDRSETAGALLGTFCALALVVSFAIAGRSLFTFVPDSALRDRPSSLDALGNLTGRVLTPPPRDLSRWAVRDASFDR